MIKIGLDGVLLDNFLLPFFPDCPGDDSDNQNPIGGEVIDKMPAVGWNKYAIAGFSLSNLSCFVVYYGGCAFCYVIGLITSMDVRWAEVLPSWNCPCSNKNLVRTDPDSRTDSFISHTVDSNYRRLGHQARLFLVRREWGIAYPGWYSTFCHDLTPIWLLGP